MGCRRRRPGSSGLALGLYECCWMGSVMWSSMDVGKSRSCPLLNTFLARATPSSCVMIVNGISMGAFGASIALPFCFLVKRSRPLLTQADDETAVKLEHYGCSDRVLLVVRQIELVDGRGTSRLCKADDPLGTIARLQVARPIQCRSVHTKRLGRKSADLAQRIDRDLLIHVMRGNVFREGGAQRCNRNIAHAIGVVGLVLGHHVDIVAAGVLRDASHAQPHTFVALI